MKVMIGVDPHKRSHTAVAIDDREQEMSRMEVRATRRQVDQLVKWAAPFDERVWAIESAAGLGYLLAQQLVAAGERVVDVPATLAARVRVLGTGRSNKNDLRHLDSEGRAFYDRKIADGKTKREALRALKRRVSDAVYRQLLVDAERRSA